MHNFKKYRVVLISGLILFSLQVWGQMKTLDDYTNVAIANSPMLKEDYAKIEQSRIDSNVTAAAYKPQLNITGQAWTAPTYGQFGYDPAITNGGSYEAVVSATQVI